MTKKSTIVIAILVVLLIVLWVVLWLCRKDNDDNVYLEDTNYTGEVIELDSWEWTLETLLWELD